jgi:hypothetical protein
MIEQICGICLIAYNRQELAEQYADSLGLRLIAWFWHPDAWRPSWALYTDSVKKCLLQLSGTQNAKTWLLHLGGAIPVFPVPGVAQANMGHVYEASVLATEVDKALPKDTGWLAISGHSYGGAITSILAFPNENHPTTTLPGEYMTFGSPRTFFGSSVQGARGLIARVSGNGDDPVAHLPPKHLSLVPGVGLVTKKVAQQLAEWVHVGYSVQVNDNGVLNYNGPEQDLETFYELCSGVLTDWGNHPLAKYLERIAAFYGV